LPTDDDECDRTFDDVDDRHQLALIAGHSLAQQLVE
jgi:hypothetical protein